MRPIALALAALLALAGCRHARPAIDNFARRVEAQRAELRIPGLSVAVVDDGRLVMARGFGTSTADTLYPIGSITKTFTSTLMLQLAEERKLDLDAPVQPYVDWQVPAEVRIRHVLSHTSEGVPGTRFVYSTRFNWLDNVVEAATKESFAALLDQRVLRPAALHRTIGGETGGLATPHRIDENGAVVESKLPPLALHSSSGLSSTVTDLARYSIALDDGTLLSASARERAWTPAYPGFPYGLGWFTQTVAGERVVWHTSWWPDAFSGLLVKVPSRGLALVLLANSDLLVSPQRGASNVLLYPIAADFLRTWLGDVGEPVVSDQDRMRLYGDRAAGERLIAAFPQDLHIQFDLAMLYGNVRPSLRINGPDSARALALFESIAASTREKPKWMNAWSNYLVAEHIAGRDPARAKTLAERALATGVDTDGLKARVEKLLGGM
ncbi:MAG TPA: serine hydrolase domain-containing protein [Thermoanaerobaculia bacterium]|nr:serine hydrolase domain-containing protein [Thermoanaerobaculia bacterium]